MRQAESSKDTVQRRKNSCLRDAFVLFLLHTSRHQPIAVVGGRCRSRADNLQPGTVEAGRITSCAQEQLTWTQCAVECIMQTENPNRLLSPLHTAGCKGTAHTLSCVVGVVWSGLDQRLSNKLVWETALQRTERALLKKMTFILHAVSGKYSHAYCLLNVIHSHSLTLDGVSAEIWTPHTRPACCGSAS